VADAIREVFDYPATFAETLAPQAARFGLRPGDGLAILRWLLGLVRDPDTGDWIEAARQSLGEGSQGARPPGRMNA